MLDGLPREPEFPRDDRRLEVGLPGGQDRPFLPRRDGAGPVRRPGRLRAAFCGAGRFRLPVCSRGILRHIASAPPGFPDRRLQQPVQGVVVQQAERPAEVSRQGEVRLRGGLSGNPRTNPWVPETISANYTLRPSELAEVLALLVEARQPIMVWGPPDAAKSMIARQVAARPPAGGMSTSARCCSIPSTCAAYSTGR